MAYYSKDSYHGISIVEAVETLSNIADLEMGQEVGITKRHELVVQDKPITYRTVHWLQEQDADKTLKMVREVFRVVLNYLRDFYKTEYSRVSNPQVIEGIKTIMVLVGEAGKKLDKHTSLFQKTATKSVTELKEYKKLQDFYKTRIARKIDEGVLGKWILGLTKHSMARKRDVEMQGKKTTQTQRIFIDLDSVKKDSEYELFFLRKENGTRFFNPRLIRNIKLVCDFGEYFGKDKHKDPLADLENWKDHIAFAAAQSILQAVQPILDVFYQKTQKQGRRELVKVLNQALMALLLASNPENLREKSSVKSCFEYFQDFQYFLKEALATRDYQKLVAYPPKKSNVIGHCLLETTQKICQALFVELKRDRNTFAVIAHLIQEANAEQSPEHLQAAKASKLVWNLLASDYKAMDKLLKHHPGGPLAKVLDELDQGVYRAFDPLHHGNFPNQLYAIYSGKSKIKNIRLPCPTYQEFIHKAVVVDEFTGFLRSYKKAKKKHLIINLQDRTTWKEYFRCTALEDLQKHPDFAKCLTVVSLPKETDFFHQLAPYTQDNHAATFMKHFKEHLESENSGFFFPEKIKKALFPRFVNGVMKEIHHLFFSDKNVLGREQRLNFIEIFYTFLQLKLIELAAPDTFSFACKDGIDVSQAANAQFFIFLKLLDQEELTQQDKEHLDAMLYSPALFMRERLMLPEQFNRMISTLKPIESSRQELGFVDFSKIISKAFKRYFKLSFLQCMVILPKVL